jgi:MFS transporter, DHA1 family, purine base/nucleoside efflux pump
MSSRWVVITLVFGAFIASINGFSLGPFLAVIADDIDSTAPLVGQAVTAALVSGAVFGLVLGPMADHYGIRRLLVFAALLLGISGVGTALALDYWMLVLTRIPGGIAAGLILGLGISAVNTRVPEEGRRAGIAWLASAGALAAIIGVPLLALIAEHITWRVGFWLIGLFGLVLPLAYIRIVPADPPIPNEPFQISAMLRTYRGILADVRMTGLQLGNLLWSLSWMGSLTYVGAYLMQILDASVSTVGYVFMFGGVAFFLGNRSAVWISRAWSPQLVMVATGLILGMTVVFVYSLSTSVIAVTIAVAIMSGMSGTGIPVITILISETATGSHGTVMMLRQFTWGMGAALGAAIGGLLLSFGGYEAVGVGFAAIMILAISSILLALRPLAVDERKTFVGQD